MGHQTDESVVLHLLDALQNHEAFTRNEAIKAIIKNKVNDQRIVDALIQLSARDASMSVRNFARNALDQLGVEYSVVEEVEPVYTVQRQEISSDPSLSLEETDVGSNKPVNSISSEDAKNRRDFWEGFGAWFILNIPVLIMMGFLANVVTTFIPNEFAGTVGPILLWIIPLGINLGVMIYYGRNNRPQVAIGMLAAFASIFTVCLCFSAVCFSGFQVISE